MNGLDRVVQLLRIGILAHLLVGVVVLCGGPQVTSEVAATLYGALLAGTAILWTWPVALALMHTPALEALRRQRGGTLEHPKWLSPSTALRFDDDGVLGRVEVHASSLWPRHPVLVGRVVLRAHAPQPAPCRLHVRLSGRPGAPPSFARVTVPLGDPELDSRVVFSAGSAAQAAALIEHGLRVPLLDLYQLSSNLDAFEIVYDGEALVITRSLMVRWQDDWAPWALRVLDGAGRRLMDVLHACPLAIDDEALESALVLEEPHLEPAAAQCLVCAGGFQSGPAAVCMTCETPLHLECWSYNGMCALFGCGSTLSRERVLSRSERRRNPHS